MAKARSPSAIVGWREWVGLPALGVRRVKAKVDTGARSSSLHAFDVAIREKDDGLVVSFNVHPFQDSHAHIKRCTVPLADERWIRSSNGKRELRPVIRTALRLGQDSWPIDLTLTSRDLMGFRMLLGREAIRRRFVVDPGRSFLMPELRPKPERKSP